MIAVASQSFGEPSQTFVRQHVRLIAPGRTVLICQRTEGAEALGCPVLGQMSSRPHGSNYRGLARLGNAFRIRYDAWFRPGVPAPDRRRIAAFLKQHRVEAVLAEFGHTGVQLLGACEEAGARLYVHFHGIDATARISRPHIVREYRRLFRRAHGIVTPSRFIGERLIAIGLAEDKLHVSPNGVDPSQFSPRQAEPGLVVAVGRLVEKKAPEKTILAFAKVAERFPEARLEIFGDGPLMDQCQLLVSELDMKNKVGLLGFAPPKKIAARMAEASLFVQHSVTASNGDMEGFPVSPIEAMASEVPVVSTRHSGLPELVEEGRTGLLVDEGDVIGMGRAMAALLGDPARAQAMGRAGRERVLAHYTEAHVQARLRAIMGLSLATAPKDNGNATGAQYTPSPEGTGDRDPVFPARAPARR